MAVDGTQLKTRFSFGDTGQSMQQKKNVIAISGMPGAGKGVAAHAAKQEGLEILVLGDVIREETERRGLEPTPENVGKVMLDVRRTDGLAGVAKRLIPKIDACSGVTIVVEGIRSDDELRELRSHYNVFTFAIHASPQTRFQRLLARGRSDDPKDWATFHERDVRELGVGLGSVVALADAMLINETSITELQASFKTALKKLKLQ